MVKRISLALLVVVLLAAASVSAESLYIKSNGVGIGTDQLASGYLLTVDGGTQTKGGMKVVHSTNPTTYAATYSSNDITFIYTGEVNFFKPNEGTGSAWAFRGPSNQLEGRLFTATGNMWIRGTMTENSSREYKENINELGGELLRIVQLRPVSYVKKDDPAEKTQLGLIAEEVALVYPEVVTIERDEMNGTPVVGIRYTGLIAPLIRAIQEQQAQIEELKKIIGEQNERLASLEGR